MTARVLFIVESGTDARMIDGLSARVELEVLAREVAGGRTVSHPTAARLRLGPANRLAFAMRAFRDVLRTPCDAVLVQGYGLAALAANVAARLRRRRCWMLVCSPAEEYYASRQPAGRPFSRAALEGIRMLAWLNARAGLGYVVLSEYLRGVVGRHGGNRQVHVIPVYGVDRRTFVPTTEDRAALRRRRGLPASGAVLFNSSRVAPEKDVETLIEAFRRLVDEGRDIHLLHRSGGHEEFLTLSQRAGIASRVIAADAVDPRRDLPLDYLAADVCVQASRAEGLGFSVLEALACGTPVVATAVGGLRETIRDGVTGWTAPPGDAPALARAIAHALDQPDLARQHAAAGAAMVRERFDRERVFDQLTALLTGPVPNS